MSAEATTTENVNSEHTSSRTEVSALRAMEPGKRIETELLVCESSQRETRSGKPYVAFTLGDETGRIEARAWSTDCGEDGPPEPGAVLEVGGKTDEYEGEPQLNIDRWEVLGSADLTGLVPSSHIPGPQIREALVEELPSLLGEELTEVVREAIELADGFEEAPAASTHHHARLGGLVEHVDSMVYLALCCHGHYCARYDHKMDISLVVAAIVLHDIGKVMELSGPVGTEYTTEGRLTGHIAWGVLLLEKARRRADADLDPETVIHLRHLILSHHGRKEWGSPVEPKTPEAVFLHQLDMLDSRMDKVLTAAASADQGDEWVQGSYGDEFWIGGGDDVEA